MNLIGFASKFYTLWDVTKHTVNSPYGYKTYYSYTYLRNISMDKDTAFAKYPGVEYDESLRGKTISFKTTPVITYTDITKFRFGKYENREIADINDEDYIMWYFDNLSYDEHRDYVKSVLIDKYGYIEYNGRIFSAKVYKEICEENARIEKVVKMINNNEVLTFIPEFNPDSYGELHIDGIIYRFNEVAKNYYNGYEYYLPVVKGKSKRIKNKTVNVTKYTSTVIDNTITVDIIEFTVTK